MLEGLGKIVLGFQQGVAFELFGENIFKTSEVPNRMGKVGARAGKAKNGSKAS